MAKKKYSDLWESPPPPPTIGQEIETDTKECYVYESCIDVYTLERRVWNRLQEREIDFDVTVDGSGPLEIKLPPVQLHDYGTLVDILWDLRNVLRSDYPYPYLNGSEQLGCHVHVRPFQVPREDDHDLKYKWVKYAIIALNLLPLMKPLVCWFGKRNVRCRDSFARWATMRVSLGRIPRSRVWSRRHEIRLWFSRSYSAITLSRHLTIEMRAFETITVNAYAFNWVTFLLTTRTKLLYGRRSMGYEGDDYMARWTSVNDEAPSKLVVMYGNEKVRIEGWTPKQFYEWLRNTEIWRELPPRARAIIEHNFERNKISTFDDAKNAGLL